MSWKNINLIFLREVRDQLRDRRTLFMVVVLPLLLYPAMGIGMVQMTVTFSEQTRRVLVLGANELPVPSFLKEGSFDPRFFENPDDAARLRVITEGPESLAAQPADVRESLRSFLSHSDERRGRMERLRDVQARLLELKEYSPDRPALEDEQRTLRQEFDAWFAQAPVQAVVVVPRGYREAYERATAALAGGDSQELEAISPPEPVVLHNSANEKSQIAYQRVRRALERWNDELLQDRLRQAHLPASLPHPAPWTSIDLADHEQLLANVWSKLFPALLVMMSVTGAFYPAVDLGAGEKERGTMETLLISPASRTEIVLGKFFTVMLFSLTTALLNLLSMGFTGQHMLSALGSVRNSPIGDLSPPPLASLVWVVLLALPLASLFSALSLSLAMFARSSKEGQYYLTPLLMVTLGLTIFCMNPGIELTPYYSVLPVVGPALLLKSLLLGGNAALSAAPYALPVVLSSLFYSLLALWWATDQFQREDILFREAERFELRLWLQHLMREKEPTPSVSEAGVCFVLILLLSFAFLVASQKSPALVDGPEAVMTAQFIFLVATVGMPPVFMALLLTTSARKTLKLSLPPLKFLIVGFTLPFALQPLSLELMRILDPFFPPLPESMKLVLGAMGEAPLWLSLAAIAVAPAVCEELAFRGFILSGLQRGRHRWAPVVISALMFGVIHMIPKQQFHAALLGLVLGLLAVRSRSLLPGVIFHFLFNGTQVLSSRLPPEAFDNGWVSRLVRIVPGEGGENLQFSPVLLAVCGVVSAGQLWWLWRNGAPSIQENPSKSVLPASGASRVPLPESGRGTEAALGP